MALDLQQARTFVETHGTPIERARLVALLNRRRPDAVPPELATLQNPDGGFPYELQANQPSTLHHTALVVRWLQNRRQTRSATAGGAYAFILSRQTQRGIWRESPELQRFQLPLWMDPESAVADIYTTALCAATLLAYSDAALAVDRAVAWLQTQQGRDGLLAGFKLHASWLAVPAFAEMLGQDARPTRRLIAGLGDALNPEWMPSMLAGMLDRLLDAGYSQRTEVVARAWELLQTMQEQDGSFVSEDGPDGAAATTLLVLDVMRRLGRSGVQTR